MPILPLIICPDPTLQICSEKVEEVNDDIRALMDDMLETMYASDGIGLAAVQVGVHKRVLVMDVDQKDDDHYPIFVINPEIIDQSEETSEYEEGCLSFPGQSAIVVRPNEVTVKYLDEKGEEQTVHFDGLKARCIQHEIDHLNGITFVDHLSRMKKDMILRKMKKVAKAKKL